MNGHVHAGGRGNGLAAYFWGSANLSISTALPVFLIEMKL